MRQIMNPAIRFSKWEIIVKFFARQKIQIVLAACAIIPLGCGCGDKEYRPPLITGKGMTIQADSTQLVGDFPMNVISTPDARFVISSDIGAHQSLWSIDTRN